MADIINLRMARKARARADATRQAEANRAAHGRTKGEKRLADVERARIERTVEGARRDPD